MPIVCELSAEAVDQERFHEIDRAVMGQAFAVHNRLGRFFDEGIYQLELSKRCSQVGLGAELEIPMTVSHRDFSKTYYLDFVVEGTVAYELKAVDALGGSHHKQLLNYLLLLGWRHGKLVNFRPPSVESRFVSTTLNHSDRALFDVIDSEWRNSAQEDELLKNRALGLFHDLGLFLEASLYREALLHLMQKDSPGLQDIEILCEDRSLGFHRMCLLNPGTAWHLSAVRDHQETYELHLTRLLNHTLLERLHWINLSNHRVILKTLQKK